jgi:hypothetical protein
MNGLSVKTLSRKMIFVSIICKLVRAYDNWILVNDTAYIVEHMDTRD